MSHALTFELPFSEPVAALAERLPPVVQQHRDKVDVDWEAMTGRFAYWKFGLFGAEGTFAVRPHANADGGQIEVQVARYRGVTEAKIRELLTHMLLPTA